MAEIVKKDVETAFVDTGTVDPDDPTSGVNTAITQTADHLASVVVDPDTVGALDTTEAGARERYTLWLRALVGGHDYTQRYADVRDRLTPLYANGTADERERFTLEAAEALDGFIAHAGLISTPASLTLMVPPHAHVSVELFRRMVLQAYEHLKSRDKAAQWSAGERPAQQLFTWTLISERDWLDVQPVAYPFYRTAPAASPYHPTPTELDVVFGAPSGSVYPPFTPLAPSQQPIVVAGMSSLDPRTADEMRDFMTSMRTAIGAISSRLERLEMRVGGIESEVGVPSLPPSPTPSGPASPGFDVGGDDLITPPSSPPSSPSASPPTPSPSTPSPSASSVDLDAPLSPGSPPFPGGQLGTPASPFGARAREQATSWLDDTSEIRRRYPTAEALTTLTRRITPAATVAAALALTTEQTKAPSAPRSLAAVNDGADFFLGRAPVAQALPRDARGVIALGDEIERSGLLTDAQLAQFHGNTREAWTTMQRVYRGVARIAEAASTPRDVLDLLVVTRADGDMLYFNARAARKLLPVVYYAVGSARMQRPAAQLRRANLATAALNAHLLKHLARVVDATDADKWTAVTSGAPARSGAEAWSPVSTHGELTADEKFAFLTQKTAPAAPAASTTSTTPAVENISRLAAQFHQRTTEGREAFLAQRITWIRSAIENRSDQIVVRQTHVILEVLPHADDDMRRAYANTLRVVLDNYLADVGDESVAAELRATIKTLRQSDE